MDLHSGLPYWIVKNPLCDYVHPLDTRHRTDVVIIGSGITGALVAHELCRAGMRCTVIDKRGIGTGSTAASTALLQYEIDVPLSEMIVSIGCESAVAAYRACLQSIDDIEQVLKTTGVDADFRKCSSVYFASDRKGLALLEKEYEARCRYGLPSKQRSAHELKKEYGLKARAALYSDQAAQMDSYRAATGLLMHHKRKSGLEIFSYTEIKKWKPSRHGYDLKTTSGHIISCRYVVVAAGFEAGMFLPEKVMKLTSTYAVASQPLDEKMIPDKDCLFWEAADPYLYLRSVGNRIIAGGLDVPFKNEKARDVLLRRKTAALERKISRLFPHISFQAEMAWCGTFSSTSDGLPYIGCWPGREGMFFALGYGGNGITFSMIAAQMIRNRLSGKADEREKLFGFERMAAHT